MAELEQPKTRHALSGWPMLIFYLAMFVFAIHACTRMVAAGDTWVALACGRHFINHGVDTVEPFSANSHEPGPTAEDLEHYPEIVTSIFSPEKIKKWHPTGWINQNWLTHVIFYWLSHLSPFADADDYSYNTLVYWKFSVYLIAVVTVYGIARVLKANPALAAVFACFSMFVGRTFLDVRPQGFSNLLVGVFILLLLLATYRNILYIWLIVPLVVFWANVHGGYIYAFVMLVPFFAVHLLSIPLKRSFVSIGWRGLAHTAGAGAAAFIAMVLFNPFHFTNLTHTFIISLSKNAELWRTVNEWHPAFEWKNPVGDEIPFLVMFIIALAVFAVWAVTWLTRPKLPPRIARRMKDKPGPDEYKWPRIDLALLAVAVLTVYMAIRSRRFIPIAAVAACPVIAMFIDQTIRMVLARRRFYADLNYRMLIPPMPQRLQKGLTIAAACTVAFFAVWWAYWFKEIYLGPWPNDPKLNSMFMRMTASSAKPLYATQFMRLNEMRGNMFNYWTEGGAIAYGQKPDPETGRTPLQLFMDGRAQAAYDTEAYIRWQAIYAGGQIAYNLRRAGRLASDSELEQIANRLDARLKADDVWVFLLPRNEFDQPADPARRNYFPVAMPRHPDWKLVFLNDKQQLYVDISTHQGKALYEGISTGQTKYPAPADRLRVTAVYKMAAPDHRVRLEAFEDARRSFELSPTTTAFVRIVESAGYPPVRQQVNDYCRRYLEDFRENKDSYARQDGYRVFLTAARIAADYLSHIYVDNRDLAEQYAQLADAYKQEEQLISQSLIW